MENLIKKRGIVKAKITLHKQYFDTLNKAELNDNIINELGIRLEKIEPCLDEFNDIQLEIELADSSFSGIERDSIENTYFSLVANIRALINSYSNLNPISTAESVESVHSGTSRIITHVTSNNLVKLPTIKLPTFNGDYSNWLEFRDAFKALVDNNETEGSIGR